MLNLKSMAYLKTLEIAFEKMQDLFLILLIFFKKALNE